jgi:hypothetical protein
MKTGIYQILNKANQKRYIGSASGKAGFNGRWGLHKTMLNQSQHHSTHLQRAWNK